MAKTDESPGSDLTELKTLFRLAGSKPVNAAFGLGPDGKAVIKLDKMQKPKALAKLLLDAKVKPVYSGTVELDPDSSSTAKFTTNKAVSGLENKLIAALKGSGVSKVEFAVEGADAAGGASAGDDDDADDAAPDASDAAQAAAGPDDTAAVTPDPAQAAAPGDGDGDDDATAASPDAAAGQQAADGGAGQGGPDAGALTASLTALVKQVPAAIAANPAQKTTLMQLATSAQGSLKQGDLQGAATAIASLQQALSGGSASPGGATPAPQAAAPDAIKPSDTPAGKAHAKAGLAWKATHAKMSSDLDQLTAKFTEAFKDHEQADQLQKAFKAKIDGVLGQLDQSLSDKLGELDGAADAAAHAKIVTEAKAIMAKYQQVVSSDPTIAAIDQNPFAPVALQKTLQATLGTLSKVLV